MNDNSTPDHDRKLLRHAVATVAYRGGRAVHNAPASFAAYQAQEGVRTPAQIFAHISDLFDWAISMTNGKREWHESKPLPWEQEVERFFAALQRFDYYLASAEPLQAPVEKLFQGPIADALTHIGQIAILRRLAGAPVKRENYFVAEITVGRVGADQKPPKREL